MRDTNKTISDYEFYEQVIILSWMGEPYYISFDLAVIMLNHVIEFERGYPDTDTMRVYLKKSDRLDITDMAIINRWLTEQFDRYFVLNVEFITN